MTAIVRILAEVGGHACDVLSRFGQFWYFVWETIGWVFRGITRWRNWRLAIPQMYVTGASSVSVVMLTGAFVGMVLAVQAVAQFKAVGLETRLGAVTNLSVVKELGPVLAGVMLAGRVGGALTAELGTMRVTEQIDALRVMGSDPIRYLVVPRFLACMLMTPFLTIFTNLMGVLGGYFISVPIYGVSAVPYWRFSADAVEFWDVGCGLIKSVFFGGAIGLIACYKGFTCKPGAEGVGKACTESFVASFLCILMLDFFLALLLAGIYESIWGFKTVF